MVSLFRSHTDTVHLVGKLKKKKTTAPLVGHGAQSLGILPIPTLQENQHLQELRCPVLIQYLLHVSRIFLISVLMLVH